MNNYIKTLIEANADAVANIEILENVVKEFPVKDEKTKTNFGNLCILLNGYRNIANATECLLINEDVLKDDDGNYYEKINPDEDIAVKESDNTGCGKADCRATTK